MILVTKTSDQARVYVCVRVCAIIYFGRQSCGRTSQDPTGGRTHRISPPSFCGACLDLFSGKDSAVPFPRRPLSRILSSSGRNVYQQLSKMHLDRVDSGKQRCFP